LLFPVLILVPQAAAKPNTPTINPHLADVIATALVLKPQPHFPDRTANYQQMVADKATQTVLDAQRASQDAANALAVQYSAHAAITPQTYSALSTNEYKAFIYQHESGNDPTRWNSSGCLGLGQACPASKLLAVCPDMDYACEDAFFTNYANARYGGWAGAYAFWTQNRWW